MGAVQTPCPQSRPTNLLQALELHENVDDCDGVDERSAFSLRDWQSYMREMRMQTGNPKYKKHLAPELCKRKGLPHARTLTSWMPNSCAALGFECTRFCKGGGGRQMRTGHVNTR